VHGRCPTNVGYPGAEGVSQCQRGFSRSLQHLIVQELSMTGSFHSRRPGEAVDGQTRALPSDDETPSIDSEARRQVGTDRRTGKGWRYGRRVVVNGREYTYRPISAAPLAISARFLSRGRASAHRRCASARAVNTRDRGQDGQGGIHDQPRTAPQRGLDKRTATRRALARRRRRHLCRRTWQTPSRRRRLRRGGKSHRHR